MTNAQRLGLGALVGAVLLALAWMGMRTVDAGPPIDVSSDAEITRSIPPKTEALEREASEGSLADPVAQAFGQGDTDEGMAGGDRLIKDGLTPGDRRANRVESSVHLVLGTVAPELDLSEVLRECTPDGRRCTFGGPWPGDDFLARWVRATSSGEISSEQLRGVTFEKFEPVDVEDGEGRFRIIALLKRRRVEE